MCGEAGPSPNQKRSLVGSTNWRSESTAMTAMCLNYQWTETNWTMRGRFYDPLHHASSLKSDFFLHSMQKEISMVTKRRNRCLEKVLNIS